MPKTQKSTVNAWVVVLLSDQLGTTSDELGGKTMKEFITADNLINFGYKKMGNWYFHPNGKISINLFSNTIRSCNPDFSINRKDNNIELGDIDKLAKILTKLSI